MLDTVEVLFATFGSEPIVRAEFNRLVQWLENQGLTAIVTGERGDRALTRRGIEEYVSDCVIVLDQDVAGEVATRHLRVVKYRGSAHGTNSYPFLISAAGVTVLPITALSLDYPASQERLSTGVVRLDHMLGGGVFRGSIMLASGSAGTGKTSLAGCLLNAACQRGERALWVLYEESPQQVLRNMRSIGLDLEPWVDAGLLHLWASRPSAYGMESHLAMLARLITEVEPQVAVLDGVASFTPAASAGEVTELVSRQFDLLKSRGITTLATALTPAGETSAVNVSSLVDTWLLLRNVESDGERNRLLFVLKSRGSAHSNQVREFVITSRGIELVDVYVGPEGVQTGSNRLAQEAAARERAAQAVHERERRRRELRMAVAEREARLAALSAELEAEQAELAEIDSTQRRWAVAEHAQEREMSARRWADVPRDGEDRDER